MAVLNDKQLKEAIKNGLITNAIDIEKQTQSCGIDLTLNKVESFLERGVLDFDNSERQLPELFEYKPVNGYYIINRGIYLVTYNEVVDVPKDCCAIARPRSSLLRMGITVETSVWDPAYKGRSQSLLIIHNPRGVKLKQNARIVQLVFLKLDEVAEKGYSGIYQGENL